MGTLTTMGATFYPSPYSVRSLEAETWYQFAAVGNGGITTFYVNGVNVGTAAFESTTNVYVVGNYPEGGQVFAEYVDEVRAGTEALTDSQVSDVYTSTLCGPQTTTTTSTTTTTPTTTITTTTTTTSTSTSTTTPTTATTTTTTTTTTVHVDELF